MKHIRIVGPDPVEDCQTCQHPPEHHDAGECWTDAQGGEIHGAAPGYGADPGQCQCLAYVNPQSAIYTCEGPDGCGETIVGGDAEITTHLRGHHAPAPTR